MQKRKWKKIALLLTGVFVGLVAMLAVHIWWMMKPRIDASTRIMARIDIHQPVSRDQADHIQTWLYQQKGVKHVLVNPASRIAVFSFAPVENDGNRIVVAFRAETGYKRAERNLPAAGASAGGCPVAARSLTYMVYDFMKRVL